VGAIPAHVYPTRPFSPGEALQARLLESCQAVVPPGGLLVHAVCYVDPREELDHPLARPEPAQYGSCASQVKRW